MNNAHKQRLITAAFLLVALITSLVLGGWFLRCVLAITAGIGIYEFFTLFWPRKQQFLVKILGVILSSAIILLQGISPAWALSIFCLSFVFVGFIFLFSYSKSKNCVLSEFSPLVLGLAYVPLILHLSLYLSFIEQCLIIIAAMATDVGGYYAGSAFGKHKIWPVISPKKSVEGSLGGCVLCAILCVLIGYTSNLNGVTPDALPLYPTYQGAIAPILPLWGWAIVGVLLNIAAQFGDFFESALKRSLHVKDSGTILPGHGGILDRIDSLLFVLPAYFFIRVVCYMLTV